MVLRSFERRLERLVEGVFARAFRTGLRPVELGRRLTREMDAGVTVGLGGGSVAPNHFTVRLSPTDSEHLAGVKQSLERELGEAAREHAHDEGYRFMGPVNVELYQDDRLSTGRFEVHAELREAEGGAGFGSLVDVDGTRHELTGTSVVIGRLPECDLQIAAPNVSRRHAELRAIEGSWVIFDLESMNGVTVNDHQVREQRLVDGDDVAIGAHVFRFDAS